MSAATEEAVECAAPTIKEATELAKHLSSKYGIGKILLFGSVARGTATVDSDIDLVAVFDDLDYTQRGQKWFELLDASRDRVGRRVDVRVTDRPEWKLRTERVPTSFEAGISDQVIPLVDLPPQNNIDWGKEIALPDTPQKEIDSHLKDVLKSIQDIQDRYYAKRSELKAVPDTDQQAQARNGRFADLRADASLVIEAVSDRFRKAEKSAVIAKNMNLVSVVAWLSAGSRNLQKSYQQHERRLIAV